MKNYLTFRALDYGCLGAIGKADADIDAGDRKQYINDSLMKIYAMLDGLADPFYDMTSILTVEEDVEFLDSIVTYSYIGGVLTLSRSSGIFQAGSLICISIWRSLQLTDPGYGDATLPPMLVYNCVVRANESGAVITADIISGTILNWAFPYGYGLGATILKRMSSLTADISGFYVKEIHAIYDDVDRGNQKVFDQFVDIDKFRDLPRIPSKQTRVGYIQRGDDVIFNVGSDADPIGVATMEYRGKPTVYTDDTEDSTIMIPPEYNQIMNDEVTAKFLEHLGEKPKADLTARLAAHAKMFEAAEANKQKAIERKNK